jgi:hypothetical protein
MPSRVASRTERDAVGGVVSEIRTWPPRLEVVSMEFPAPAPTITARPIITLQHRCTKLAISRCLEVRLANGCVPTLPVRVSRADQMVIARRLIACGAHSGPDVVAVLSSQRAPAQGLRDAAPLARWRDSAERRGASTSRRANPRPSAIGLRGIVPHIEPRARMIPSTTIERGARPSTRWADDPPGSDPARGGCAVARDTLPAGMSTV